LGVVAGGEVAKRWGDVVDDVERDSAGRLELRVAADGAAFVTVSRRSKARARPMASSREEGRWSSTSTPSGSPRPAVKIAICCGCVTSAQRARNMRNFSW